VGEPGLDALSVDKTRRVLHLFQLLVGQANEHVGPYAARPKARGPQETHRGFEGAGRHLAPRRSLALGVHGL